MSATIPSTLTERVYSLLSSDTGAPHDRLQDLESVEAFGWPENSRG